MLFNSYEFIFVFLPIVFICYFCFLNRRWIVGAKVFLVIASLCFYAYWNVIYLPLILFSLFCNYIVGMNLSRSYGFLSRKSILICGIVFNLSLLGYFKYMDFFIDNFNGIFGSHIPLHHVVLPLGISFFTFTQIAFLVDAYRGEAREYSVVNYMLFVTYFPHLLAGPILHHKEMMPQFSNLKNYAKNYKNIAMGCFIFSLGLFKKVVIADGFALWANAGFDGGNNLNLAEAWITSLSYTFELYFDFSGYTDMAIGLSLLFNIKLPVNFNSPYKAKDIQDFWRRWHMTLSRFLRDYLYIPLGGSRKGELRTYINLMITFILGGLWHGAGWTFVLWGFLHGLALVIHRVWKKLGLRMHSLLAWFLTFNFINITWIFFRAKDMQDAWRVLSSMFSLDRVVLPSFLETKMEFLHTFGISFGFFVANIGGDYFTPLWILCAFVLVLYFKNSMKISCGGGGGIISAI